MTDCCCTCTKKLNTYLANLGVWTVKLHSLHWNVTGRLFHALHTYTEQLYDESFEAYDAVAELMKMRDQFPLSTMKEYLEYTTLEEALARVFTCCEVTKMLEDDMTKMRDLALEIRAAAAEKDDFRVVTMFEDFIKGYDKQLWFLHAMRKEIPAPEGTCTTGSCETDTCKDGECETQSCGCSKE